MYISDAQARKHMSFIGTTGVSPKLVNPSAVEAGLAHRFNDYRSRHGNESLTLFVGRWIYGGDFLCSHRDSERAQLVELG